MLKKRGNVTGTDKEKMKPIKKKDTKKEAKVKAP